MIEGIDGSGKSTTALALEKYYKETYPKLKTVLVRFPRHGESSGYLVDQYLQSKLLTKSSAITTSLLYSVDKAIYFEEHTQELIDADIIIFDRFYISNAVYQMPNSHFCDYKTMDVLYLNEFLYLLYTIYINEIVPFLFILAGEYIDATFKEMLKLHNPMGGIGFKEILSFLENSSIQKNFNTVIDNLHTFTIYHPKIETNQKMLSCTGKELDRNEVGLDFLSKVNDSFDILYNFTHRGVIDAHKKDIWFFNRNENDEETDDSFNKLILNPSVDLFKKLFCWERIVASDADGKLYPTNQMVERVTSFVSIPPRAMKRGEDNDKSKDI